MGSNIQTATSWARPSDAPSNGRALSPLLWLSMSCLDAPSVAVSWQWLFARTLHTHLSVADRFVLFLTAWLIYLSARVADSFTIPTNQPTSARQKFCLKHRMLMIALIVLISVIDATCAWRALDRETLMLGAVIGAAIGVYFVVNHLAGFIWKMLPLKEVSIGFLFALGTVVAIHGGGIAFSAVTFFFATLCSLNCLSISVWERPLDLAQDRASFATSDSGWDRFPEIASWLLALTALLLALNSALRLLALCLASSAAALAILNRAHRIPRDVRVALADLVLLTPLVFFCRGGL